MLFSLIASQASTSSAHRSSASATSVASGYRAAGHVGVHVEHRAVGLEIDAAGIEQNALAHQRHVGRAAAPAGGRSAAAPAQVRDAGGAGRVAARHGEKGAGAQALQLRLRIPAKLQADGGAPARAALAGRRRASSLLGGIAVSARTRLPARALAAMRSSIERRRARRARLPSGASASAAPAAKDRQREALGPGRGQQCLIPQRRIRHARR